MATNEVPRIGDVFVWFSRSHQSCSCILYQLKFADDVIRDTVYNAATAIINVPAPVIRTVWPMNQSCLFFSYYPNESYQINKLIIRTTPNKLSVIIRVLVGLSLLQIVSR